MDAPLNYIDHLAFESARFAEVLREAPPHLPVPTCPEWTAEDLLWHLAEVQWFWGTIVRSHLTDSSSVQELKPDRPGDSDALFAFFQQASDDLRTSLAAATPETPAWTWSQDHSVGFIRRRQAHEALIHRVDAEVTTGQRTSMDAHLSADGVDEALRVMYGGVPPWGSLEAEAGKALRLQASDTGGSWWVALGRFRGTDPEDNREYDEPDIRPADTDDVNQEAPATVVGTAADLNCWLWHRPTLDQIEQTGDAEILADFESTIAAGID